MIDAGARITTEITFACRWTPAQPRAGAARRRGRAPPRALGFPDDSREFDGAPGRPRAGAGRVLAGTAPAWRSRSPRRWCSRLGEDERDAAAAASLPCAPRARRRVTSPSARPGRAGPSRAASSGSRSRSRSAAQIARYGAARRLRRRCCARSAPACCASAAYRRDTRTAGPTRRRRSPAWASQVIGPADLRRLRRLPQESGWRVLLTVGLAHYDPVSAAREVAGAHSDPRPWLAGIEIGNEPDSYGRHGLRRGAVAVRGYSAQVTRLPARDRRAQRPGFRSRAPACRARRSSTTGARRRSRASGPRC